MTIPMRPMTVIPTYALVNRKPRRLRSAIIVPKLVIHQKNETVARLQKVATKKSPWEPFISSRDRPIVGTQPAIADVTVNPLV